jgi:hypothetical protein
VDVQVGEAAPTRALRLETTVRSNVEVLVHFRLLIALIVEASSLCTQSRLSPT